MAKIKCKSKRLLVLLCRSSLLFLLRKLKIDDPLDAIPVHGVGGFWGTLAVYIFK